MVSILWRQARNYVKIFSHGILDIFFRASGRQCIRIKAKNPKTAKFLKWELKWEKRIKLDFDLDGFRKYEKNPTSTLPHFLSSLFLSFFLLEYHCAKRRFLLNSVRRCIEVARMTKNKPFKISSHTFHFLTANNHF